MRAWTDEELRWARDCAAAGDEVAEIAEMAERPQAEVAAALSDLKPMTARQRQYARLYSEGLSYRAIEKALGLKSHGAATRSILKTLRANGYPIPPAHDRPEIVP